MKVRALKRHNYAKVWYNQGDEYYIDNIKHLRLLQAVKRVKIIPEKVSNINPILPKSSEYSENKFNTITLNDEIKTRTKRKVKIKRNYKSTDYDRKDMVARKDNVKRDIVEENE